MSNIVSKEQAGAYVQIAHTVEVGRGPGTQSFRSERPRDAAGNYREQAGQPTILHLEEGDRFPLASLLVAGALVRQRQPAAPRAKRKGGR